MNWFQRNFKSLLYLAFIIPILAVAFVSISHVTTWYGISNPMSWAIYLSIGIEIAALSALAAISAQMGSKVYFPFSIVTIIQFIGNIFFAYQYIDVNGQLFKSWVELVDPLVSLIGVESGDTIGHKRFLALFSGGMLPLISLSFLHMLVKFEEEGRKKKESDELEKNKQPEISNNDNVVVDNNVVEETKVDTIEETKVDTIEEVIVEEEVNDNQTDIDNTIVEQEEKQIDSIQIPEEKVIEDTNDQISLPEIFDDSKFKSLEEIKVDEPKVEDVIINFEPYYEEPVYEDPVYYDEYEIPEPTPTYNKNLDGVKRLSYTKKYGE